MSQFGDRLSSILLVATESAAAWNDSTRGDFDKRYTEPLGQKIDAYEASMAALQDSIEAASKLIDTLQDL